jgi:hypothetical protein
MTTKKQIAAWKEIYPEGPYGFAFTLKQIEAVKKANPNANGVRVVFGINKGIMTSYLEPANLPVSKSVDSKTGGGLPCPTYCS